MSDSRLLVVSHTWKVSAFTVTLTVDLTPGARPARNVWRPFQPSYFTPGMQAEYQAGLHAAIAKIRAARGEPPATSEALAP